MRVLAVFWIWLGLFAGACLAQGLSSDARQRIVDDKSAFLEAAEVARLSPSLSPHARGRLIARQAQAHVNGNGTVDAAELQGFARFEALRLVPDKRAEDLRLILLFDADGDGWVSFAEVKTAVAGIAA